MLKHVLQPCERAIIRKDLHNIWHTRMIRLTVILVPALLCLVLPAFYLAIAWFLPAEAGSVSDDLAFLQSAAGEEMTERQLMVYLVAQLLGPMFFLMYPPDGCPPLPPPAALSVSVRTVRWKRFSSLPFLSGKFFVRR